MRLTSAVFCAVWTVLGCDTGDNSDYAEQSEILSIEDENTALRARLESVEQELMRLSAKMDQLSSVYRVEDGDAVIKGANLRIQNGTGKTECYPLEQCNGKGNLIIGYDEPRGQCVDSGARSGFTCWSDDQCTGGRCEHETSPYRTGSHNLIVGEAHGYTGFGSVAFGVASTIDGQSVSVLGGGLHTATGIGSVVVGGSRNVATGLQNVSVGGQRNHADGDDNVVVGGSENATNDNANYSVMVGHIGHEIHRSGVIAPDMQSVQSPF